MEMTRYCKNKGRMMWSVSITENVLLVSGSVLHICVCSHLSSWYIGQQGLDDHIQLREICCFQPSHIFPSCQICVCHTRVLTIPENVTGLETEKFPQLHLAELEARELSIYWNSSKPLASYLESWLNSCRAIKS